MATTIKLGLLAASNQGEVYEGQGRYNALVGALLPTKLSLLAASNRGKGQGRYKALAATTL